MLALSHLNMFVIKCGQTHCSILYLYGKIAVIEGMVYLAMDAINIGHTGLFKQRRATECYVKIRYLQNIDQA